MTGLFSNVVTAGASRPERRTTVNDSSITIISPRNLAEAKELATTLSAARTLPEALQQKPADVMAIVMAGAELGLAPMQSIRALVLIKGKPTLSADAMGALVKSRRDVCTWLRLVESSAAVATYETLRNGDPGPTRLSFTIEQARTAGLNGDNWKRFPDAMLRARALSALCRAVYPDLLLGVYDPEELEPAPREVNAAPVVVAPQPSPPVEAQVVDAPPSPPSNVRPITQTHEAAIAEWVAKFAGCATLAELDAAGRELAKSTNAALKAACRTAYDMRRSMLARAS